MLCSSKRVSYAALSTAIGGALSSGPSRIFLAGCIIMSASSALSGRVIDDVSGRLGVPNETEDEPTGDDRDELLVDPSGGVPPLVVLFARAFVGSLT